MPLVPAIPCQVAQSSASDVWAAAARFCACTSARSAARLHQHACALRLREIVDHSQQRHVHSAAAAINHVQNAAIRCPHKRPQRPSAPVSWRCASQRCLSLPPSPTRSECQREASQVTIERMRAVQLLVYCYGPFLERTTPQSPRAPMPSRSLPQIDVNSPHSAQPPQAFCGYSEPQNTFKDPVRRTAIQLLIKWNRVERRAVYRFRSIDHS